MASGQANTETYREAFISSRNNILRKSFVTDLWMKVIHRAIDDIVMYRSMKDMGKELNEEDLEFEDTAYKFLFDDNYRIPVDDYLIDIECSKCKRKILGKMMSDLSNNKITCDFCKSKISPASVAYKESQNTITRDMNIRELLSLWGIEDIAGFRDGVLDRIEELTKKKTEILIKKQQRKKKMQFEEAITKVLVETKEMLLEKNKKYGDSATNPVRIFSKSDRIEQIKVRIDDKLSRIVRNNGCEEDEDVKKDLIGYFVILKALESGYID